MGLLEKFDQVEVKSDDRISAGDRAFCAVQQEAYKKAREIFKKMAKLAGDGQAEQIALLKRGEDEVYTTYLGTTYDFGADKFLQKLDDTHRAFVNKIVHYFANKYHVSLDEQPIYDAFVQKKPEEPRHKYYYRNYCDLTDEEVEEVYQIEAAHAEEVRKVEEANRALVIRYENILDYIFAQLGGGSFGDVAIKELKDACHKACWYEHNGQPKFEQKKAVIRFTGYACGIDHIHEKYKSKGEDSEFRLTDDMKDVLAAVNHFELGTQSRTMTAISKLCGYRIIGQDHPISGEKIVGVKLYKTNRVDLRFSSEAYAREFVEQYIGTVA